MRTQLRDIGNAIKVISKQLENHKSSFENRSERWQDDPEKGGKWEQMMEDKEDILDDLKEIQVKMNYYLEDHLPDEKK